MAHLVLLLTLWYILKFRVFNLGFLPFDFEARAKSQESPWNLSEVSGLVVWGWPMGHCGRGLPPNLWPSEPGDTWQRKRKERFDERARSSIIEIIEPRSSSSSSCIVNTYNSSLLVDPKYHFAKSSALRHGIGTVAYGTTTLRWRSIWKESSFFGGHTQIPIITMIMTVMMMRMMVIVIAVDHPGEIMARDHTYYCSVLAKIFTIYKISSSKL